MTIQSVTIDLPEELVHQLVQADLLALASKIEANDPPLSPYP